MRKVFVHGHWVGFIVGILISVFAISDLSFWVGLLMCTILGFSVNFYSYKKYGTDSD